VTEDDYYLVVVDHLEMRCQIVGPFDLDMGDTMEIENRKGPFQFEALMASSGRRRELMVDKALQCSRFPIQAPTDSFMGQIADLHHQH